MLQLLERRIEAAKRSAPLLLILNDHTQPLATTRFCCKSLSRGRPALAAFFAFANAGIGCRSISLVHSHC